MRRPTIQIAILAAVALLIAVEPTSAQRQLEGGSVIVLDDGTVPGPTTIRLAVPNSADPGARADSLLFSWEWTLPIGPAPAGTDVGATVNTPDDRYFFVADTAGISRWEQIYDVGANNFWLTPGNAMTTPGAGSNFVGTGDSIAFLLYANNERVARYAPVALGPNIIYGHPNNSIVTGVSGATIAGGGSALAPNEVLDAGVNFDNFAAIGGGADNRIRSSNTQNAAGGVIPGGFDNLVTRANGVAMGLRSSVVGPQGVAMGDRSRATTYGFAAGRFARANGARTLALGDSVLATGNRASAIGKLSRATGQRSLAVNRATTASGSQSFAFGDSTTAAGTGSLAGGFAVATTGGSNRMILGSGFHSTPAASRFTNGTNNSLFVGFNDVGSNAGNNAALAVVGPNVGVGMTSPGSRLTVQASTDDGAGLPAGVDPYVLDLHDSTTAVPGSHLFVMHSPNVGLYNHEDGIDDSATANGGLIGIGDPLNGTLNTGGDADPTTAADTARLMIRGWGTTDASYALLVEDSGGVDPLFGIRDDGKMLLKTGVVDDFDGFNFNGHVGPAVSGIRGATGGFDLGSCDFEFRDAYFTGDIRFDYGRAFLTHDATNNYLEFQTFDTSGVGDASATQTLRNGSFAPGPVAGEYVVSQTFGGNATGAIDSIDIYLEAATAGVGSELTVKIEDGLGNETELTIQVDDVIADIPGYVSFSLLPLNLDEDCATSLTWTLTGNNPFTIAYQDNTPCVTSDANHRARFDFEGDLGWRNTSGPYGGGSANISSAGGGVGPVVQYDTLCDAGNAGFGNCFTGGDLCGNQGASDPTSFIQENPQDLGNSSAISVNTRPIDYTFRAYLVEDPLTAIAIESATNFHTRMGQGAATPDGQLDVQSETGAVIVPRMGFTDRGLLPAIGGSIVYQTDTGPTPAETPGMYGYDASIPGWKKL